MGETVIRVENLGKKYLLRHEQAGQYKTLRDAIAGSVRGLKHRFTGKQTNAQREEFWALKDVSFEVKQGEVVGIIGRNGAGKSTLLKILSRITEPTTGRIAVRGRVASLLEVGTGFHPELTGRENIFLNGAVLGMSRAEINRKFDEIVAFAEVEKFLDTPVKRYSSGMYVRLAFAVAAHLEPEILIIDEVLAVGDITFQKKCLGKISEVTNKSNRTVIFVSHNMMAIQQICSHGLILKNGITSEKEIASLAIKAYLEDINADQSAQTESLIAIPRKSGLGDYARISSARVLNSDLTSTSEIGFGESFFIELECLAIKSIENLQFVVGIDSITHGRISTLISDHAFSLKSQQLASGRLKVTELFLNPGEYLITVGLKAIDQLIHIKSFSITEKIANSTFVKSSISTYGLLQLPNAEWVIKD